ncbi:MAG: phenylacetate-CoA oxygenase subunit PaaJ [Chitinophagaceae bacterium]|nr:phenylacetate-CoA oxygenase subunit PaaJ [Chitinophagaceae bacterium]
MSTKQQNINHQSFSEAAIWGLMRQIYDPEIPVISIVDLGIVRAVEVSSTVNNLNPKIIITITPTYSGCPAMDVIGMNIRMSLLEHGFKNMEIKTNLSPAWTTDWMSAEGKEKLRAFGIAPPNPSQSVCSPAQFQEEEVVQCPHCNAHNTKMVSRFGSTACKALYQCNECQEPFDYFKCH